MSNKNSRQDEALAARVTELETLFTHLQRTVGELDQVVLAQQKRLESLEGKVAAMRADLNAVSRSGGEERTLEDEKPPHY